MRNQLKLRQLLVEKEKLLSKSNTTNGHNHRNNWMGNSYIDQKIKDIDYEISKLKSLVRKEPLRTSNKQIGNLSSRIGNSLVDINDNQTYRTINIMEEREAKTGSLVQKNMKTLEDLKANLDRFNKVA